MEEARGVTQLTPPLESPQPTIRKVTGLKDPVDERAISKKIHVLGADRVGRFLAHSLIGIAEPPPVTLLVHRPLLLQRWNDEGRAVRVIKDDKLDSRFNLDVELTAGFHVDGLAHRVARPYENQSDLSESSDNIIENLICTTEGHATISALSAIRRRLRSYSTICFIQDGLGIIDEVNSSVFPRPTSRPSYMLGNISHDLQSIGNSFTVLERQTGILSLTIIPPTVEVGSLSRARKTWLGWTPRSKYLIRTMCRTPELQAKGLLRQDFFKAQLEKLAINSVLGPLSVVNNCTNDQLLHNYQVSRTMKPLLKEISSVLQQLPEVSRIPDIDQHFSPERLGALVVSVIEKTGNNYTSMLQDVMEGKRTNIDFYNGYLVNRATELGIECPHLEMMLAIVKGKQAMRAREKNLYIPFRDGS